MSDTPDPHAVPNPTSHDTFPCGGCGSTLEFTPGAAALECPYCGHSQEIEVKVDATVDEQDYEAALAGASRSSAAAMIPGNQGREVECKSCGAISIVAGAADRCAFCGGAVILREEDDSIIAPESLLPFKIEMAQASKNFKKWVSTRWFAPNDLADRAKRDGMDGVYLPYWTYDANTRTSYRGERGEYYYETEHYTDSEGNSKTRQVRKTRWYPAFGSVGRAFDDVLVCGSKSLPHKLVDKLEPWDLKDLKPFDPAYLSGFLAERYGIDLPSGFAISRQKMEPKIRSDIQRDIGGDTQRISSFDTSYSDVTFKHLLLPLWISSFRYKEKVYRFVVNARTGAANGERPYSAIKIALAIIAGLILVGGVVAVASYLDKR